MDAQVQSSKIRFYRRVSPTQVSVRVEYKMDDGTFFTKVYTRTVAESTHEQANVVGDLASDETERNEGVVAEVAQLKLELEGE